MILAAFPVSTHGQSSDPFSGSDPFTKSPVERNRPPTAKSQVERAASEDGKKAKATSENYERAEEQGKEFAKQLYEFSQQPELKSNSARELLHFATEMLERMRAAEDEMYRRTTHFEQDSEARRNQVSDLQERLSRSNQKSSDLLLELAAEQQRSAERIDEYELAARQVQWNLPALVAGMARGLQDRNRRDLSQSVLDLLERQSDTDLDSRVAIGCPECGTGQSGTGDVADRNATRSHGRAGDP